MNEVNYFRSELGLKEKYLKKHKICE